MKKAFCFSIFFALLSFFSYTQEINKVVADTALGREVLIGYCDRFGLSWGEFLPYMTELYDEYVPEQKWVRKTQKKKEDIEILIVLATWCGDSKNQVPPFLKFFDEAGFTEDALTMICVNRAKQAGDTDISDLNIERVPTFIFYRNGKELGRIIETPDKSLERDTYKIIKKKL